MTHEHLPEGNESHEDTEVVFRHEIKQALSPVFAKTIQELLPGYLLDKPKDEFTQEEIDQYCIAHRVVGEMVQNGEADVLLLPKERIEESELHVVKRLSEMRYILHVDKGHRVEEGGLVGTSELSFNQE